MQLFSQEKWIFFLFNERIYLPLIIYTRKNGFPQGERKKRLTKNQLKTLY